MGANVSSETTNMNRELTNSLKQSCKNISNVEQKISGNRIILSGTAKCGNIVFKNDAKIESTCDIAASSEILAKYANKLTEAQKSGLGFNVSTNINETKENINSFLENKCGNTALAKQSMSDNAIEITNEAQCKSIEFINSADLTSGCIMNQVVKAVSDIDKQTEKTQSGLDFGSSYIYIIFVAVFICIICVIFLSIILCTMSLAINID